MNSGGAGLLCPLSCGIHRARVSAGPLFEFTFVHLTGTISRLPRDVPVLGGAVGQDRDRQTVFCASGDDASQIRQLNHQRQTCRSIDRKGCGSQIAG